MEAQLWSQVSWNWRVGHQRGSYCTCFTSPPYAKDTGCMYCKYSYGFVLRRSAVTSFVGFEAWDTTLNETASSQQLLLHIFFVQNTFLHLHTWCFAFAHFLHICTHFCTFEHFCTFAHIWGSDSAAGAGWMQYGNICCTCFSLLPPPPISKVSQFSKKMNFVCDWLHALHCEKVSPRTGGLGKSRRSLIENNMNGEKYSQTLSDLQRSKFIWPLVFEFSAIYMGTVKFLNCVVVPWVQHLFCIFQLQH